MLVNRARAQGGGYNNLIKSNKYVEHEVKLARKAEAARLKQRAVDEFQEHGEFGTCLDT